MALIVALQCNPNFMSALSDAGWLQLPETQSNLTIWE